MYTKRSIASAEAQAEPVFLARVRDCILKNLDEESFGVAGLAQALFISRSQLFRRVKALTGCNVARYIHRVRIGEVKRLLIFTELSVAEISWRTGFTDPSYLRRVFLQEEGETLANYRWKLRKKAYQEEAGIT